MVNSQLRLNRSFDALSHPVRRAIVARLAEGTATVGEATRGLPISKPAVTKHLKVLEQAGVVERRVEGRNHRLSLRPRSLEDATRWLELHRSLWEAKFDAVERHLREHDREEIELASTEQGVVLRLSRRFEAPRERVFDAWTNPEVLRQWWAAFPTWDTPEAEVDLRQGGRYRLSMRDTDSGDIHTIVGEYTEIARPERLAYTWTWEDANEKTVGSENTQVVVEFAADGEATEVVVTHHGFANEEVRDSHGHGWQGCLDNLERRVFATR